MGDPDKISIELEWALPEVSTEEYPKLLKTSRHKVATKYRAHMGERYSAWLSKLKYRDVDSEEAT